jgi:hypothetical protein
MIHTIQVIWDIVGDSHPATDFEAHKIARDYLAQEGNLDGCPKFVDIVDGSPIPAQFVLSRFI